MAYETLSPALKCEMDDIVRGMAKARLCRSAVVARDLLFKSIAESRAEKVLGREDQEIVVDTLNALQRLIERFGPGQGEGGRTEIDANRAPRSPSSGLTLDRHKPLTSR